MVAVGLLLNSYLVLGALRNQVELQKDWNRSVAVIAEWQGPVTLSTQAELNGRQTALGIQEARGPRDFENSVHRLGDGLKRLAREGN